MKTTNMLAIGVLTVSGLAAQVTSPAPAVTNNPCPKACASAANFSVDSYGTADTRPSTWGFAQSTSFKLTFTPPAGYQVRILSAHGDLVSWPKTMPGQIVPVGSSAGVLVGLQTTSTALSTNCDACADNTMLYAQDAVVDRPVRTKYDQDTSANGLLMQDNILIIKVASWLNTTGYPIHMEPTFTVSYRYEQIGVVAGQ